MYAERLWFRKVPTQNKLLRMILICIISDPIRVVKCRLGQENPLKKGGFCDRVCQWVIFFQKHPIRKEKGSCN